MDPIPTDPQAITKRACISERGQLALDFVIDGTGGNIGITTFATLGCRYQVDYGAIHSFLSAGFGLAGERCARSRSRSASWREHLEIASIEDRARGDEARTVWIWIGVVEGRKILTSEKRRFPGIRGRASAQSQGWPPHSRGTTRPAGCNAAKRAVSGAGWF
jgi:hypothetical protein